MLSNLSLIGAILTALATIAYNVYDRRTRKPLDKATTDKIATEAAKANDERFGLVYEQMAKMQRASDKHYRNVNRLIKYIYEEDAPWHRAVIDKLEEAQIHVPEPPKLPELEQDETP